MQPAALIGVFILIFQLLSCPPLQAEVMPLAGEVSAAEKQQILKKFREVHKDVHSISASVSQEKKSAALRKVVKVEGTVTMAKPGMLKWDVTKPERALTVIDGETMTVYHPTLKEAQVYPLSEHLIARNTVGFFATAMSGTLDEMEQQFKVSVSRIGGEIVVRLVPLSRIAGRYLESVMIYYDEQTALPKGFEMTTPKGDRTVTKLSNLRLNPGLDKDAFRAKLPKDVWVTNKQDPIGN